MRVVKVREVKIGDTLPVIAADEYGDARLWRLIAEANGLDDPLRFPGEADLGHLLVIPGR